MGSLSDFNERAITASESLKCRRSRVLLCFVVLNVVLAASPVLRTCLPSILGISPIGPFARAVSAVSRLADPPLMLLVVWCGLGASRPIVRILGGVAGIVYQATISVVLNWQLVRLFAEAVRQSYVRAEPIPTYLQTFARSIVLLTVISALWLLPLLAYRARFGTLRRTYGLDASPSLKPQLRLSSLFLLTLIVALYLGLGRSAQSDSAHFGFDTREIAQQGLYTLTFGLIAFWGLRVALVPGRLELRKVFVFFVNVLLLGNFYAVCLSWSEIDWSRADNPMYLTFWSVEMVGLPAAIYLASLLVVRYCGYRLIPDAIPQPAGA